MKTMRFAAFIAAAMSVLALASCNKNPEEGQGAEGNAATVLFSAANATNIYAAPGEATTAEIKIVRLEGTEAATYGIKVVDADEGIEIPESVEFAKDQKEASITISAPAGKAYDKLSFEIMLTGDNVNASANSEEGTLRFEAAVYVYEECITLGYINDYNYVKNKYIGYFKQKIWRMADGLLLFKDFLGCGADLTIIRDGSALSFSDFSNKEYYDFWYATDEDGNATETGCFAAYKSIDENNGEYLPCYPKGDDQRYIEDLWLYFDPDWSYYYAKEGYFDQIIIYTEKLTIKGESENINEVIWWDAFLNFVFFDEETIESKDYSYPELGEETLIGEGTTELWGLGTEGTSELYKVVMSTGEVYYSIKGWYGEGTKDFEIAFNEEGKPYVHSTYDKQECEGYVYTTYYTGCTDYYPYDLAGYEGFDTLSVTDAEGTALTTLDDAASIVITFKPYTGPEYYDYDVLRWQTINDEKYSAWKFTYPAVAAAE